MQWVSFVALALAVAVAVAVALAVALALAVVGVAVGVLETASWKALAHFDGLTDWHRYFLTGSMQVIALMQLLKQQRDRASVWLHNSA